MYDADAIEAIDFEQLATDRLLFRRGQVSKRPPTEPSIAPPAPLGPLARGSYPYLEGPSAGRPATARHPQVFAITVVIPTLIGIAIGLAALL